MRIEATSSGVRLAEPAVFDDFVIEDRGDPATLNSRLNAAGAGRFDGEHAWIRCEWMTASVSVATDDWRAGFARMRAFAAERGWLSEQGEIRAHMSRPDATTATDSLISTPTGLRQGTFGFGTFARAARPFPAVVRAEGEVVDVSDLYGTTRGVLEDWEEALPLLAEAAAARAPIARFEELRALPPVERPDLLCAGSNYVTHVAQMLTKNRFNQHNRLSGESDEAFFQRNYEQTSARRLTGTPFLWTGMHSSLVGATDDIVLPELGDEPDWELEVGIVVGRVPRYATLDEAAAAIAGYVMINDLGTVDVFRRTDIHFGFDWISKNQPTFKPIGPFIVPAPFVDLADTTIRLAVNGDVMQDWPADDYIFGPAQLVAYASERVGLLPGDVIAMGSPPGNAAHHGGRFLQEGDLVESEITGLGRQRNRCVAEDLHGRTPVFGHWTNTPD